MNTSTATCTYRYVPVRKLKLLQYTSQVLYLYCGHFPAMATLTHSSSFYVYVLISDLVAVHYIVPHNLNTKILAEKF